MKVQKQLQNLLKLIGQLIQLIWVIYTKYNIYIDYNKIGDEGAKAIGESLKINNSINFINLGNYIIFI